MAKRLFGIAMAVVMGAAIAAGCGSSSGTAAASSAKDSASVSSVSAEAAADSQSSSTAEASADGLSGEGKSITALFFSLEGEYFTQFDGWLRDGFEALGYSYESQSSNFDAVTQIEQIENAVAKGMDCIWIWAVDGKQVHDACKAAKEQGVKIYSFVQNPGEDAVNVSRGTDEEECGNIIGELAVEWADEEYGTDAEDGAIKTIFIGNETSENMKTRFDAAIAKIQGDSRFDILEVVTTGNSTTEGQSATENMYAKYGDEIDCIITIDGATVLGVLAYIDSESCVEADPARLGVFATEMDTELADYMRRGLYDGAGINGGNPYVNVSEQIVEVDNLINGKMEDGFSAVDIGICTVDNLEEYGY